MVSEIKVGKFKHAALKPCYWFEERLRTGRRNCYKSFFGVKSHLCIQCTSYLGCNLGCAFCWRNIEERMQWGARFDDPHTISEELINEQINLVKESQRSRLNNYVENIENAIRIIRILSMMGKATIGELTKKLRLSTKKVRRSLLDLKNAGIVVREEHIFKPNSRLVSSALSDQEASEIVERLVGSKEDIVKCHEEALKPRHVAISYSGEPMLYPQMGELVAEFRKRKMTTFIVTNGTLPERIENLSEEPTQLYVTLPAPDKDTYLKVCSSINPPFPASPTHWRQLNKTLELLSSLSCRTCIRITAVRRLNMIRPEKYRQLVEKANPNFVEVKGFMRTGYAYRISRRLGKFEGDDATLRRIARHFQPSHEEILKFAEEISGNWEVFPYIGESRVSTYVLMAVNWKNLKNITIKKP